MSKGKRGRLGERVIKSFMPTRFFEVEEHVAFSEWMKLIVSKNGLCCEKILETMSFFSWIFRWTNENLWMLNYHNATFNKFSSCVEFPPLRGMHMERNNAGHSKVIQILGNPLSPGKCAAKICYFKAVATLLWLCLLRDRSFFMG